MELLSIKEKIKNKRISLLIGIIVAGLVLFIFFGDGNDKKKSTSKMPEIKVIKEEESLEEGFKSRFSEDLTTLKEQNVRLQKDIDNLSKKTVTVEEENKNLKAEVQNANEILLSGMKLPPPDVGANQQRGGVNKIPPAPGETTSVTNYNNIETTKASAPSITVMSGLIAIGEPIGKFDAKKEVMKKTIKERNDLIIPSGSFVKGSLLSGVIAPTMGQGANQPVPSLIRITDLAVLPNFFKTDIKNCFLLAETKGNLATETVSFRLKTLACKRNNGETIERTIDGYVTGENGSEGLSGRVVSKQGAIIARAFAAEFLGGIASAFQEAGNIVTTTGSGVVSTIDPNKTLETGLFSGAAGAFSRVSDFYMDLADNMVPVIEINAGRTIDLVFLKPVNLSADEPEAEGK